MMVQRMVRMLALRLAEVAPPPEPGPIREFTVREIRIRPALTATIR